MLRLSRLSTTSCRRVSNHVCGGSDPVGGDYDYSAQGVITTFGTPGTFSGVHDFHNFHDFQKLPRLSRLSGDNSCERNDNLTQAKKRRFTGCKPHEIPETGRKQGSGCAVRTVKTTICHNLTASVPVCAPFRYGVRYLYTQTEKRPSGASTALQQNGIEKPGIMPRFSCVVASWVGLCARFRRWRR